MSGGKASARVSAWVKQEVAVSKKLKTPLKFQFSWHGFEEKWNEMQVGRQGSYSVERLESFHHYCQTTSKTRVVLVCVLTPLPALVFLLLLECLPLRTASEGWAANWMFWVRMSLMVFTLVIVGVSDLLLFVPNLKFTVWKRFVVALGSTVAYVGTCILATSLVGFPIPFMWQFGGFLLGIFVPAMILMVFGFAPFEVGSPLRPYFMRYLRLFLGFMALAGVYPLYKVMYDRIPAAYKATLIVLPIWKFAAKHFMINVSRELEDFIPMIVALNVDLFSALFVSVCISTSGSIYLSAMFIAADVGQSLLEFREVRANSSAVLTLLHKELDTSTSFLHKLNNSKRKDLLEKVTSVTRNPSAFQVVSLRRTRLWACLPHTLTPDQAEELNKLDLSSIYGPRKRKSRSRRESRRQQSMSVMSARSVKSWTIVPGSSRSIELFGPTSHGPAMARGNHDKRAEQLVVQSLQLLFHCEYLGLVEYIECVVPLAYASYKSVLSQLPNADFYPDSTSNWGTPALTNILVFAALEVGSLALLNKFLQRKFQFTPLYQVAFALETQMYLVQASLFPEIVVLLQYELVHLGADFTFRFKWLHTIEN